MASKNKDFTRFIQLLKQADAAYKLAKKGDKDERLKALVLYREAIELLPAVIKTVKAGVKTKLEEKLATATRRVTELEGGLSETLKKAREDSLQREAEAKAKEAAEDAARRKALQQLKEEIDEAIGSGDMDLVKAMHAKASKAQVSN
eukprot:SAG31_NODE_2646_length_5307_cov_1.777074_4_plen_147_part_00